MKSDRARWLRAGSLTLLLATRLSAARAACDPAHAVALDIVDAPAAAGSEQLAQSVIAELGASQIAVCTSEGAGSLSRLQIRALLPAWQRASIRLESAHSPPLERDLDVSKLPPEARALAIASASDELIRAAFAEAAMAPTAPPPPVASSPLDSERTERDRLTPDPLASATVEPEPLIELGLVAAGSSYLGQREAIEGDLAARYWLMPRVPLSARVGIAQRLSRPLGRGPVQPDSDVHAAVGAGFTLLAKPGWFALIGEGGVHLTRVSFDERMRSEGAPSTAGLLSDPTDDIVSPLTPPREGNQALDHGWALAASLGIEGRVHTGLVGFSMALAGLAPLVPARSDWGNHTSLDTFGVQLRAGVWMLLGSRVARADAAGKDRSP